MLIKFNWIKQEFKFISRIEFNEKLYDIRHRYYMRQIATTVCRRIGFFYNTYQLIEGNQSAELRVFDVAQNEIVRYKYMNSQLTTDEQNDGITGSYCYEVVDEMFKKQFGYSVFRAFSGQKYREIYTAIKKCVPKQPHYAIETRLLDNGYKSDVSSAFPTQLIKSLPTLHNYKQFNGRVEPTEDYPFAFYLNSHHLKIYGELDSRDFENKFYYKYYNIYTNDFVPEDKEVTILCKKSEYSFEDIMRNLYNNRKINTENKKIMNAFIGVLHYNKNPQCSHLAAVVIARCVKDMCDRAKQIEAEGNKVYLISTDAILWRGKQSSVSSKEKYLGSFTIEEENIRFCIRSCNCYQFEHNGQVITKFSGKNEVTRTNMQFEEIFNYSQEEVELKDIYSIDGYFLDKNELEEYKNGNLFRQSE